MGNKKVAIIVVLIVLVLIAAVFFLAQSDGKPGKYDGFAQCVKDSGAIFYGAFWCPHCRDQKAMFGKSQQYLSYVECSTPDGSSQMQICIDKEIKGYPTWDFKDGKRENKVLSLKELSEITGCVLPE